jgi:hypothetical protein
MEISHRIPCRARLKLYPVYDSYHTKAKKNAGEQGELNPAFKGNWQEM